MNNKAIVILTGAGISAESGIPTFRASDGLWCNHKVEDVATPEGFARNPDLVQQFYNTRRAQLKEVEPNAAHQALAELANNWEGRVFLVTQNVDDLHERAQGNKDTKNGYKLLHMHGELKKARCLFSDEVFAWEDDLTNDTICSCCGRRGSLRPHIVWFGEMPLEMDLIYHMLDSCDLFIAIGTSGNVYPASGFVHYVRSIGNAHTVELNAEPSAVESLFHEKIYGQATYIVPKYVNKILAEGII
ncbi:MAG: Sir2 family NAD+-dependent deacetylase [Rickettsiales bacterium]